MNRGAIHLKVKLEERGHKAKLSKALDVGMDVVSHWLSGDRKPDAKNRAGIEDVCLIPWRSWDLEIPKDEEKGVEAELRREAIQQGPTFPDASARTGTER